MRAFVALIGITATFSGCFYDSRMGQARREQKNQAARLAPATLEAPTSDKPVATRRLHVRVLVAPEYAAQVPDVPAQLRATVSDANRVLAPALGVELDAEPAKQWDTKGTGAGVDAELDVVLRALEGEDPGDGADLVLGLVGSVPRASERFHDVGMARMLGKHLVLRAPTRLAEHEVARTYDELSDEERTAMTKQWKQHRATVTLLHEIGHVLGAPHETASRSLMSPSYDRSRAIFGDGALRLMRSTLESQTNHRSRSESARLLLAELDAVPAEATEPQGRAELAALLRARSDAAPAAVAPPKSDARPEWQETWALAQRTHDQGDAFHALEIARPVFAAHPDVLPIQDARCKWALEAGAGGDSLHEECAPYNRLLLGDAAPAWAKAPKKAEKPAKSKATATSSGH